MTLLAPYRVLDLTGEEGLLAGFLLAQLGADVIVVEAPSPAAERSITELAYNRGKRSVELDLSSSADDRARFRQLAADVDVLLTMGGSGDLAALGIDFAELSAMNPRL